MELKCKNCNTDLKEISIKSSKSAVLSYSKENNRFELRVNGDDSKFSCPNCNAKVYL